MKRFQYRTKLIAKPLDKTCAIRYTSFWNRFHIEEDRETAMATIADIAAKAGVGVGTVSRVLNNNPAVSEKTRSRVLAVMHELDYHPSHLAQGLSRGRTFTVGVIAPFFTHPSVVERLRGIVESLRVSQYDLVLFNVDSPAQRAEYFQTLMRRDRADGFIIISLPMQDDEVARFRHAAIPLALIDVAHTDLPYVIIDNIAGGRMAAQHLLDLGHRRIAFVGDHHRNAYGFTASRDRCQGFLDALTAAGVATPATYRKEGQHDRHIAHRLTTELLALPERPTAIFAASDTQALGVIEAAQAAGLTIPGDLSVIGFDDIEVAPYVGLTTIRQPLYQSGARGATLLLDVLSDATPDVPHEVLPLELVVRRTTSPLAH
ncbi:MAG: LacI family DNA-binding transcriptional regulator [Ktedonobacterales bacterium]|nr:LacI family DNA-binding transcriptional regulator [Ktedonobacterales bacterium]